jgi:hypothetical protein
MKGAGRKQLEGAGEGDDSRLSSLKAWSLEVMAVAEQHGPDWDALQKAVPKQGPGPLPRPHKGAEVDDARLSSLNAWSSELRAVAETHGEAWAEIQEDWPEIKAAQAEHALQLSGIEEEQGEEPEAAGEAVDAAHAEKDQGSQPAQAGPAPAGSVARKPSLQGAPRKKSGGGCTIS